MSSNSKSSTIPVTMDSGRSRAVRSSHRLRSTSIIAPIPIIQQVSKKGRKLSSTSSPTFNPNRASSSSETDSPSVIPRADDKKKSSMTKMKFEQRQKEQTVKEKRKSTEGGDSRNDHVQVATRSSTLGKEGAAADTSEALRVKLPNPYVRLVRLQLPQPKSEVPEAVDTHADLNESERSPPADPSTLIEQATINISNNILESDESMDESDDPGESVIDFNVTENAEGYRTLRNSEKTDNHITVGESLTKSFASFMSPEFGSRHQEFPGVSYSLINASDSQKVGYMRIAAKTLRPFDCMENVQVLYWILSGTVTIRSTGGFYSKGEEHNKSNFLFGKSLSTGSCIMIPPNTCFTVENWEEDEALIGYSMLIGDL